MNRSNSYDRDDNKRARNDNKRTREDDERAHDGNAGVSFNFGFGEGGPTITLGGDSPTVTYDDEDDTGGY